MSSILDNPAVRQVALPITVEQYHRLCEAGIISERTELICGVIVEKTIKSPNHSWLVQFLVEWLRANLPEDVHVRQEQPLTLADSEPEPDIAVVSGVRDDFRDAHPRTAKLVIEVAISSVDIDREKGTLYAAATIDEYVIVLPDQRSLEIHTNPTESGYKQRHDYQSDSTFELASFPNLSLDLCQLFC